jgi:hypothetical protein
MYVYVGYRKLAGLCYNMTVGLFAAMTCLQQLVLSPVVASNCAGGDFTILHLCINNYVNICFRSLRLYLPRGTVTSRPFFPRRSVGAYAYKAKMADSKDSSEAVVSPPLPSIL